MKFITHLILVLICTNQLFAQSKITQAKGVPLGSNKDELIKLLQSKGENPQKGYQGNMLYVLDGSFGGNKVKDTKYYFDNFDELYEISFVFSTENKKQVKATHKEIAQYLTKKYGPPSTTDSLSEKKVKLGNLYSSTTIWSDSNEKLKGRRIYLKNNKLKRPKGSEINVVYLTYKDLELDYKYNIYLKEKVDEDY